MEQTPDEIIEVDGKKYSMQRIMGRAWNRYINASDRVKNLLRIVIIPMQIREMNRKWAELERQKEEFYKNQN